MAHRSLRCSILAIGDFPEGGATSQRLYLLARLLNEGLGDTSVWILHPASKVPIHENCSDAGQWGGVKFAYLSGATVRPMGVAGALLDTIRGVYNSVCFIASRGKNRPDVLIVYTPSFLMFIIPMVVAKFLRIPMIVEVCEIFSKSTDKAGVGILRRLANSGEPLMERLTPLMAAGLLVISRGIQQFYEKLGAPREASYLLPVLIDTERYQQGGHTVVESLRGVRYFLNSGSFNEKDGLTHLVQAMASVHAEYPEIKLVFTGAAPKLAQERILKSAGPGAHGWVIFAGLLSRDQLIWSYKNALGLLSCRTNSEYANYGFPTKLAEYLASGRPVVATMVGDVKEYLEDGETAFLAEPENIESIALAMRRLIQDPVRAGKIGHQGAEVARQYFDYRNHVQQVSTFIRRRLGIEGKG